MSEAEAMEERAYWLAPRLAVHVLSVVIDPGSILFPLETKKFPTSRFLLNTQESEARLYFLISI